MITSKYIYNLTGAGIITLFAVMVSCEKYLDKEPEAIISDEEVFGTFENFEGFVEEMYHCIPDYTRSVWVADWNIGVEILATTVDWYMDHLDWTDSVRSGEYLKWIEANYGTRVGAKPDSR